MMLMMGTHKESVTDNPRRSAGGKLEKCPNALPATNCCEFEIGRADAPALASERKANIDRGRARIRIVSLVVAGSNCGTRDLSEDAGDFCGGSAD